MMRWALVAGAVIYIVALAAAADGGNPARPANHEDCRQCAAEQDARGAAGDQPADNLAAVLREDTRRERIQTLQEWGFTLQELQLIRAYKMRMHRLKEQLDEALQNLAVIMYSRYEDPKQRLEVARAALEKCQQIQREDERLQQELIDRVGARDDPVKMAGLILLGAVSGGRRTMCEVHVGVAGGAQATGGALPGPQLRHTLGGPPKPWRPRVWRWWWRQAPGARGYTPAGTHASANKR